MNEEANLNVEYISVDHVMPYQYNARTHSDDQVAQIAGSMTEFGFVNPILIDDNGGIIAGHGRLMAARMLGIKQVPAIRLKHLSETQRRALMIADNKIAENAGWDENLLRQELQALEGEDFNLSLLGFGEDELDELLGDDDSEGLTDENAAPEVPEKPVSVLGDLWICGDHKILCGDSALIDSYQTLLGEELADMVFTDPPYNVNYANSMKDKMRGKARPIQNDNLGDDFGAFLYDVCTNLMMVNKGALYICMSSSELHEKSTRMIARDFLENLIKTVPYKIHTILTDNGIQFAKREGTEDYREIPFDRVCLAHDIDHRLTKVKHPWTNGQVERMNRTLKDATVKKYYYQTHDQLKEHMQTFLMAYNFARRLKTLNGLTPYEYICKISTNEPDRFTINPFHHTVGLNI